MKSLTAIVFLALVAVAMSQILVGSGLGSIYGGYGYPYGTLGVRSAYYGGLGSIYNPYGIGLGYGGLGLGYLKK